MKDAAKRDRCFVYVETDGDTARNFFEREDVGFRRTWTEKVKVDDYDSGVEIVGLRFDPFAQT